MVKLMMSEMLGCRTHEVLGSMQIRDDEWIYSYIYIYTGSQDLALVPEGLQLWTV